MISILIPVYNVTVYSLVRELSVQLEGSGSEGEIIVFDDFSNELHKVQNRSVTSLKHVFYKELDKNYGRSGIRRLLAEHSRFDWLLFLDSDSVIIKNDYLQNFLQAIGKEDVYVGGRVYQQEEPADCPKRLHWKYGRKRESVKGSEVFHTNNFCIRKEVFLQLSFPAQLVGYGHEDTWMDMELSLRNKRICFINNPVLHDGIEEAELFLEKTKNALKNLLVLTNIFDERLVRKKVRLYNLFYWQRKAGISKMIISSLKKRIKKIESNLVSCNPSLKQFDLYRLYHLLEIAKRHPFEK